jgi:hypothetical protein
MLPDEDVEEEAAAGAAEAGAEVVAADARHEPRRARPTRRWTWYSNQSHRLRVRRSGQGA